MIAYLARDIPAFVMYCVNAESGSFLLIESTDSMIRKKLVVAWCTHLLGVVLNACEEKSNLFLILAHTYKYI